MPDFTLTDPKQRQRAIDRDMFWTNGTSSDAIKLMEYYRKLDAMKALEEYKRKMAEAEQSQGQAQQDETALAQRKMMLSDSLSQGMQEAGGDINKYLASSDGAREQNLPQTSRPYSSSDTLSRTAQPVDNARLANETGLLDKYSDIPEVTNYMNAQKEEVLKKKIDELVNSPDVSDDIKYNIATKLMQALSSSGFGKESRDIATGQLANIGQIGYESSKDIEQEGVKQQGRLEIEEYKTGEENKQKDIQYDRDLKKEKYKSDLDIAKLVKEYELKEKNTNTTEAQKKDQLNSGLQKGYAILEVLSERVKPGKFLGIPGTQRVTGIGKEYAGKFGWNDDASMLDSESKALSSLVVRKVFGEKGTLNEGDNKRAIAVMPSSSDTIEERKSKMFFLKHLIDTDLSPDEFIVLVRSFYNELKPGTKSTTAEPLDVGLEKYENVGQSDFENMPLQDLRKLLNYGDK